MLITDSQVHIWESDRPDRPWPRPLRNNPQLPAGFGAGQMIAAMDEAGVDRAIIVPPTWVGDANETALDVVREHPTRFAIMGRFDPTAPDAESRMATWSQQPNMLGIRLTFRVSPYSEWLTDGTLDWFWAAAERYEVPVACLVVGEPGKLQPIAAKHPNLTLLVDHMGCNLEAPPEHAFAAIEELLALAQYPRVFVKVSSAPCFSTQEFPFADVIPYLKRIHDALGARRCMWGADLTRLRGTYTQCLAQFTDHLDFLSDDDKEWVLGKTVAEVLNWPEA